MRYTLTLAMLVLCLASCEREEVIVCAPVTVDGKVMHHEESIPFARVFYKKGTKNFPGEDTTIYDGKVQADATGYYKLTDVAMGTYYLYGVGFDNSRSEKVDGGTDVDVACSDEGTTVKITVPVVE